MVLVLVRERALRIYVVQVLIESLDMMHKFSINIYFKILI